MVCRSNGILSYTKKYLEKLQKIKGHEHDCGRPGINGGYIDNPNVRFGVNVLEQNQQYQQKNRILWIMHLYIQNQKKIEKLIDWQKSIRKI